MAKPSAPRKIGTPEDPAAVELLRASRIEAARLKATGATVNIDPRTGLMVGAWRKDCFTVLLTRKAEDRAALEAVLWLEELLHTARGENTPERRPDHIRASCEGAPGQNVSQAMIEAGRILVVVTEALSPRDARMLFRLLYRPDDQLDCPAGEARLTRWRPIVEGCTGETNPQAQGAAVRSACANLLWVRQNIDRLLRERRERREAA